MPTMSGMKCKACEAKLAMLNTNPDGLCGTCQKSLRPGQSRYEAWVAQGRPALKQMLAQFPVKRIHRRTRAEILAARRADREAGKVTTAAKVEVAGNHVQPTGLPPVDRLPLEYLALAVAEFRFRMEQAEKISALARKLKV